jgi:hypothetical protein
MDTAGAARVPWSLRAGVVGLACWLSACGVRELPTDCAALALLAEGQLAAGDWDEARRTATKLREVCPDACSDARHTAFAAWQLARCTLRGTSSEPDTLVELRRLLLRENSGGEREFLALSSADLSVLLADARQLGLRQVEHWLLVEALEAEPPAHLADALRVRLQAFSPRCEPTAIDCDWANECESDCGWVAR